MSKALGQQAVLNGKPVKWAGEHFGWQSPASYKQLDEAGEFKLGSIKLRGIGNLIQRLTPKPIREAASKYGEALSAEQQRKSDEAQKLNNPILRRQLDPLDRTSNSDKSFEWLSDKTNVNQSILETTVGLAEGLVEGKIGLDTAVEALVSPRRIARSVGAASRGGRLSPSSGEGVPSRPRKGLVIPRNYTSPAQRAANRARAQRHPVTRVGPNSQWDNPLTPEQQQVAKADGVRKAQRGVKQNNRALNPPDTSTAKGRIQQRLTERSPSRRPNYPGEPGWLRNSDGSWTKQPSENLDRVANRKHGEKVEDLLPKPKPQDPGSRYPATVRDPNSHSDIPVRSELPYRNSSQNLDTRSTTAGPGQEPSSSRGSGPNPQREFRPDIISRKEVDVPDVNTSDMAKPRGDGNSYDIVDNPPTAVPARERNRQRNAGIEARLEQAKDTKIADRSRELNLEDIRDSVGWADGDYDKLARIAEELGLDPQTYKYPSKLEAAINKRLSSLENTYAGKPSLNAAERTEVRQDYDYQNSTGRTQTERSNMAASATRRFGSDSPDRQPIRPVDNGSHPASSVPEIDARIRGRTEANLRPSRSRSQNRSSTDHPYVSDAEKAMFDRMNSNNRDISAETAVRDKELADGASLSMTERQQAAAERRRRRKPKPLRPIEERLNRR